MGEAFRPWGAISLISIWVYFTKNPSIKSLAHADAHTNAEGCDTCLTRTNRTINYLVHKCIRMELNAMHLYYINREVRIHVGDKPAKVIPTAANQFVVAACKGRGSTGIKP